MSNIKNKKKHKNQDPKISIAQSKNKFKQKLEAFCSLISKDAYSQLSESTIEVLFQLRQKPIRVIVDKKAKLPDIFLECIAEDINNYLQQTIELYKDGPKITWKDYIYYVLPMQSMVATQSHDPKIVETFGKISRKEREEMADILLSIARRAEYLGFIYSNFFSKIFCIKFNMSSVAKESASHSYRWSNDIFITVVDPTYKHINVGGEKRLAARVGWGLAKEVLWVSVKSSDLGKHVKIDVPMEVYMQQHAILRLYERIDAKYASFMNSDMINSFYNLKAFPVERGNFLIEHRIFKLKVGYFLASIHDGVLLIRTFLFITHNGTPEGKKLTEITGLQKLDQKYLNFDNLLKLANSDIISNAEARNIFIKAGCGELLKLCEIVRNKKDFWEISDKENPLSEKILKYIKDGKRETFNIYEGIDND